MLIVALALAVVGLAALVAAVVTSNEILAWVCIAASATGVLLLVVDAVRERQAKRSALPADAETAVITAAEADAAAAEITAAEADAAAAEITAAETAAVVTVVDAAEATAEITDAELADDIAAEEHPEEVVHDEPDFDAPGDDEPEFPEAAEAAAIHVVTEDELRAEAAAEDLDVFEEGAREDGAEESDKPGER